MRTLPVVVTVLLLLSVPSASAQPADIGSGEQENEGCVLSPAECLGATNPLPIAGSAGSTNPRPGCQTGRVVTPDAGAQSDAMPFCPDGNSPGNGAADPSTTGQAGAAGPQDDLQGDGPAEPPPPPPPPPTHPEIVATVCPPSPSPVIGHSPHQYGITGLETWLWSDGIHTSTATGVIRGYPVDCTLTATQFTFDTGDDHAGRYGHQRVYTSPDPGTEDETTDVRHMWEVKGTYQLALTITWSRTSNYGADTTTSTTTKAHPVKEIVIGMTTAPNNR